jgi:hypothetical protein
MPMTLRSVKNASLAAAPLPSELSPDELRLSKGEGAVGDGEGGEGGSEGAVDKFGAVGSGIAEGIRTHERLHVA